MVEEKLTKIESLSQETGGEILHKPISSFSDDDKPREKMVKIGPKGLSNSELLAILIGSGTTKKTAIEVCQELLDKADNSLRRLFEMDWRTMTQVSGIGMAKAITIKAALEIGVRVPKEEKTKIVFKCSDDIYYFIRPDLDYLDHEEIWIVFLRRNNTVIDKQRFSTGGQTSTVFDVKAIIREALNRNANALVMIHNHPSGNLRPSNEDRSITRKLRDCCEMFDIRFLDHLILGENEYYSFADEHELSRL